MVNARPDDLSRMYLQSFLSRRMMSKDVALEMYKRAVAACQEHEEDFNEPFPQDEGGLTQFIGALNGILEELGMEIRNMQEQTEEGKLFYALVNTDYSILKTMGSDYIPIEITYYREVITAIISTSPAYSIGTNQALNLTKELEGTMSVVTGESLLKSFVSRGWLEKSKYSLGLRAIMELEPWLVAEFEEYIIKCKRCSKICLNGVFCGNQACDTVLHPACYKAYKNGSGKCPGCKVKFDEFEPSPLGEAAVPRAEDTYQQVRGTKRKSTGGGRKRRKSKGKGRAAREEVDDELESEEGEGTDEEELIDALRDDDGEEEEGSGEIVQAGNGQAKWAARSGRRQVLVPETQEE